MKSLLPRRFWRVLAACLLVLLGALPLATQEAAPPRSPVLPAGDALLEAATDAYVRGEFAAAQAQFAELLARGAHDRGGLLYALGHCALERGDPARASWYYLRAAPWWPGAPELADSLKAARQELGLPADLHVPSAHPLPGADLLWLVLAAGPLTLALLLLVHARRRASRRLAWLLLGVGLLGSAAVVQRLVQPPAGLAVVLEPELPVRPDTGAGPALFTLRAGELVRVRTRGEGWVLVDHVLGSGYVRAGADALGELERTTL